MRVYVEAFGCTRNFGEPRETEEALSGDFGLGSVRGTAIADATSTHLIGDRGDTR